MVLSVWDSTAYFAECGYGVFNLAIHSFKLRKYYQIAVIAAIASVFITRIPYISKRKQLASLTTSTDNFAVSAKKKGQPEEVTAAPTADD